MCSLRSTIPRQFRWLYNDRQSVTDLFLSDVCLCDLQGGVDDTISLTAYITAALVEIDLEKNVSNI